MIIKIKDNELDIFRIILVIICIVIWFMIGIYLGQISQFLPIFYVVLTIVLLLFSVRYI